MVPPIPKARAASSMFCAAGITEPAAWAPLAVAQTSTITGASPISLANRIAERMEFLPGGRSSGPYIPASARLAHQASW